LVKFVAYTGWAKRSGFLGSENYFSKGNFMWGIHYAHSRILKVLPWAWFREKLGFKIAKNEEFRFKNPIFLESGSGKHFQGSEMRAIDSPHKIIHRGIIFGTFSGPKKSQKSTFLPTLYIFRY
jgi:hypothetical protein